MTRPIVELSCLLLLAGVTSGGAGFAATRAVLDPAAVGATRDTMPRAVREPEVMTLQDALTLTLLDNPALSSWPWELRALDADTRQASRRPNPRAGALVENIRTEGIESTLQISQLVELGGKRSRRMALARAERAVANWAFESARADVVALTARLFVEALAAQERVAIQGELVRVAQETSAAVSTRVRAGGASYVEDTRAQLALEGARVELASAEREQAIAYRRLAAVWGNFKPQFSVLRGDLTSTPPPVPLDSLLARIDRNPDVARWAAEISRRESLRAAARASRVPDVDLDVGVRRLNATQETGLLLGIGVPIPVFDRVQDGATAAELRIQSASEQRRTSRAETVARLAVAYEDAAAGLDEYHRLQDDLLPKARSCHEATRSAYRSGLLRLTDVLDVQRTLFEVRLRAVDALVRYHTAAFEIERLTGMPVAASNTKEPE